MSENGYIDSDPDFEASSEERSMKVKEIFSVLIQGVEIIHFERGKMQQFGKKYRKVLWMDTDILRLCVDVHRPTLRDRKKGKIPPGLYMRDVADVRAGTNAYPFHMSDSSPDHDELCLFLTGTETTMCLEFPSKMTRDWFLERFELIIEDIHTNEERNEKLNCRYRPGVSYGDVEEIRKLLEVLHTGSEILHHHPVGKILPSILTIDRPLDYLILTPIESKSIFNFRTYRPMKLAIDDIIEIRLNTHAMDFITTQSLNKQDICLSLIGTEGCFHLEFPSKLARDYFAMKLQNLIFYIMNKINEQNQGSSSP